MYPSVLWAFKWCFFTIFNFDTLKWILLPFICNTCL
jgi:hypothetical protein